MTTYRAGFALAASVLAMAACGGAPASTDETSTTVQSVDGAKITVTEGGGHRIRAASGIDANGVMHQLKVGRALGWTTHKSAKGGEFTRRYIMDRLEVGSDGRTELLVTNAFSPEAGMWVSRIVGSHVAGACVIDGTATIRGGTLKGPGAGLTYITAMVERDGKMENLGSVAWQPGSGKPMPMEHCGRAWAEAASGREKSLAFFAPVYSMYADYYANNALWNHAWPGDASGTTTVMGGPDGRKSLVKATFVGLVGVASTSFGVATGSLWAGAAVAFTGAVLGSLGSDYIDQADSTIFNNNNLPQTTNPENGNNNNGQNPWTDPHNNGPAMDWPTSSNTEDPVDPEDPNTEDQTADGEGAGDLEPGEGEGGKDTDEPCMAASVGVHFAKWCN